MQSKSTNSVTSALNKFSHLLIKEKLLNPVEDESAIYDAIGSAAQNFSQTSFTRSKSPKPSTDFVNGPLASMLAKHQRTQNKIEELRKKKYVEEVSRLQDRPVINKESKNLVKNMPPLHLRTEKILKEKGKKLEGQRKTREKSEDSDFSENCTFKPKSKHSSRSRSPDVVTQELYKWNENRNKILERKRKEQESKETVLEKPKINNLSSRLTKTRCITPVHERLAKVVNKELRQEEYSFTPQIVPKSRVLAGKNSGKGTPVSSRASSRASCRSRESSGSVSKRSGYKINTCLGVIDKHNAYVNCLQVNEGNRDFLNRLNKLRNNL